MNQERKMGRSYRAILRGMSLNTVEKEVVKSGDFNLVESKIKIIPFMAAQGEALTNSLKREGVIAPRNIAWILLHSDAPGRDMSGMMRQVANFNDFQKSKIIIELLRAVHNTWVTQNRVNFFDSRKANLRCRYMPFEMVGYVEILKYRVYTDAVIKEVLGWKYQDRYLQAIYRRMQENYRMTYNLFTSEDLEIFLAGGKCNLLSKEIVGYLRENPTVLRQVVTT